MKKAITMLVGLLFGFLGITSYAGNTEVNVTTPGSLRDLINELPLSRINNLTITGELNGTDISYLVGGAGKMAKVDSLDISQIGLVGDDQPYKTLLVAKSDIGFGTTTETYYLSEADTIISDYSYTGLGGSNVTRQVYCKDLSGAFAENSSFKYVVLPQDFTKMANYMFYKNSSVESVVLPSEACSFGKNVFEEATELKNVNISNSIKEIPERTFRKTAIETLNIPSSVEVIGDRAFEEVPIKSIDLSHVKFIGNYSFYRNQLSGVLDLSSLEQLGSNAFQTSGNTVERLILSDKLNEIPDFAFPGLGINEIDIPYGVVRIGDQAFYSCNNLNSVTIPETVLEINRYSFFNTPWYNNLQGENGIIYAGSIAMSYDDKTKPVGTHFSFRDGTTVIANSDYASFFPTHQSNWKMESVKLPSSLKRIGSYVFSACKDLQSIELPEELAEIGNGVFEGCTSLKNISIPSKIKEIPDDSFRNCESLESVVMSNVESIGESAFCEDTNLFDCELPISLKSIGKWAFWKCKSLTGLTFPENLEKLGEEAFRECDGVEIVTIKSTNLKETENRVFSYYYENNQSIYKVNVAKNVTRIPDYLFDQCEGLTKLIFEDIESSSLKSIGNSCFSSCRNLSVDKFPESLDSIGKSAFLRTKGYIGDLDLKNIFYVGASAFEECEGITSLTITNKEIRLGSSSFSGCDNLKTVKILSETIRCGEEDDSWHYPPFRGNGTHSDIESVEIGASLKEIPDNMFADQYELNEVIFEDRGDDEGANRLRIGKGTFARCGLTEVTLPQGTNHIGEEAFSGNASLVKVVIPNDCDSIDAHAFSECYSLDDIEIGEGLQFVGERAFNGCVYLRTLELPTSCKEIGLNCFYRCDILKELTLLPEVPPVFQGDLGYGFNATIYVPGKSLDSYKDVEVLKGYVILPIPGTEPSDPGDGVDGILNEADDIMISVKDGIVEVSGKGERIPLKIVDVNGVTLIETYQDKITDLSNGTYVLTVGDRRFKFMIRE